MEATNATFNETGKMQTISDKLSCAVEAAKDQYARVRDRAVASASATDTTIREHPYQSLGIAFALGLLIGVLANRGSARED
jgi:ElaB/YqjD/DUF883 family membrane-anchored ribosome-binding protein